MTGDHAGAGIGWASGVPTYVLYPAGAASQADVLPELLTKDVVLEALEKDLR